MPTLLTQRLEDAQRMVLRGISESTKALHVVDALAGTGKSHLARCLISRWGSLRHSSEGYLLTTLRTRSLRQEFLESLLSDKVALLKLLGCSIVALSLHFASALSLRYFLMQSFSRLATSFVV